MTKDAKTYMYKLVDDVMIHLYGKHHSMYHTLEVLRALTLCAYKYGFRDGKRSCH